MKSTEKAIINQKTQNQSICDQLNFENQLQTFP